MANKIEALTEEQRAQCPAWAQKYVGIQLGTGPAPQEGCVTALKALYEAASLPQPAHIVFVKSPTVAALAGSLSAGIWYLRKRLATTESETDLETRECFLEEAIESSFVGITKVLTKTLGSAEIAQCVIDAIRSATALTPSL